VGEHHERSCHCQAREEIRKKLAVHMSGQSQRPEPGELFNPEQLPSFHDPFAGGGSLPLEAQRLGLASHASDLKSGSCAHRKATIEIRNDSLDKRL